MALGFIWNCLRIPLPFASLAIFRPEKLKHTQYLAVDIESFWTADSQERHGEFEPDKAHSTVVGIICPPG
jgi:hypothetical protein